jgi:hypothetical protein
MQKEHGFGATGSRNHGPFDQGRRKPEPIDDTEEQLEELGQQSQPVVVTEAFSTSARPLFFILPGDALRLTVVRSPMRPEENRTVMLGDRPLAYGPNLEPASHWDFRAQPLSREHLSYVEGLRESARSPRASGRLLDIEKEMRVRLEAWEAKAEDLRRQQEAERQAETQMERALSGQF